MCERERETEGVRSCVYGWNTVRCGVGGLGLVWINTHTHHMTSTCKHAPTIQLHYRPPQAYYYQMIYVQLPAVQMKPLAVSEASPLPDTGVG